MTRSSSVLILILLLKTSIAHELRIHSRTLSRNDGCLRHALEDKNQRFSLSVLCVRGGSDYYRVDDEPEERKRYDDQYGGGNQYTSDRNGGDNAARSSRDDDRYDDYDHHDYRETDKSSSTSMPNLPNIIRYGDRRIGLALLGSGSVFTMLGISLFFNKSLMRLGNLLFIGGVPMTIGPGRTAGYFFQPKKSRATACLALGIFLVFIGSPVFGIALEIFGLLNLFGNMFPIVAVLMKQMPVVGSLFGGGGGGNGRRADRSSREGRRNDDRQDDHRHRDSYDDRYEDDRYGRDSHNDERWSDADRQSEAYDY